MAVGERQPNSKESYERRRAQPIARSPTCWRISVLVMPRTATVTVPYMTALVSANSAPSVSEFVPGRPICSPPSAPVWPWRPRRSSPRSCSLAAGPAGRAPAAGGGAVGGRRPVDGVVGRPRRVHPGARGGAGLRRRRRRDQRGRRASRSRRHQRGRRVRAAGGSSVGGRSRVAGGSGSRGWARLLAAAGLALLTCLLSPVAALFLGIVAACVGVHRTLARGPGRGRGGGTSVGHNGAFFLTVACSPSACRTGCRRCSRRRECCCSCRAGGGWCGSARSSTAWASSSPGRCPAPVGSNVGRLGELLVGPLLAGMGSAGTAGCSRPGWPPRRGGRSPSRSPISRRATRSPTPLRRQPWCASWGRCTRTPPG